MRSTAHPHARRGPPRDAGLCGRSVWVVIALCGGLLGASAGLHSAAAAPRPRPVEVRTGERARPCSAPHGPPLRFRRPQPFVAFPPDPASEPVPLRRDVARPPRRPRGRPLLVLLHGADEPPGRECGGWVRAGATRFGWLLCPKGQRHLPGPPARYTFYTATHAWRQAWRGIRALRARAPGRVARRGHVLVGYSLGAHLAPWVADQAGGFFRALVLYEGVPRFHHRMARRLAAIGVRRVAFLCAERAPTAGCLRHAPRRAWYLRRHGIATRIWKIPRATHRPPRCLAPWAQPVLRWALGLPEAHRRRPAP